MDPHIGGIGRRDAIPEPLVGAFVDDDEIELRADAHTRPIAPVVAVGEPVAVRDGALVLHACVRHLDQLIAIFLERVLAKVVLERLDHFLGLRELALRFVQILGQRVEIHGQIAQRSEKCS